MTLAAEKVRKHKGNPRRININLITFISFAPNIGFFMR